MTQEVRVTLQLTLDCDTMLDSFDIEAKVKSAIHFSKDDKIDIMMIDIFDIQEEAEIYGTEEEKKPNPYHIDYKRQTKLDL